MSISDNDIASFYPAVMSVAVDTEFPKFRVVEQTECEGSQWFCITVTSQSLDAWLQNQCETNEEKCFEGSVPWANYCITSCYNVHESVYLYISLKWG